MSKNLLWQPGHPTHASETPTLRAMRWFFLILVSVWIFVAMVLPVVTFCFTKNPLSLSLFSTLAPPVYILHRIAKYLFPRDEKDFQLAAMKIQHTATNERNKNRSP